MQETALQIVVRLLPLSSVIQQQQQNFHASPVLDRRMGKRIRHMPAWKVTVGWQNSHFFTSNFNHDKLVDDYIKNYLLLSFHYQYLNRLIIFFICNTGL